MSADLDDIYELIEFLPQDLKDRFTNLRELDLSVENNVDRAKMLEKLFFANAQKMSQSEKKASHEEILRHYSKAKEDADEKVEIATSAQDLLERLIRVLSTQIDDKKRAMEKENPGCTDAIERAVEAQQPSTSSSQKENRYNLNSSRPQQSRSDSKQSKSRQKSRHLSRKEKKRRDSSASSTSVDRRILSTSSNMSLPESRPASVNSGPLIAQQQSSSSSTSASASSLVGQVNSVVPVNNNLAQRAGHIGPGGNAIAAAASQAIAATQQMQQGRRTASLKASYEAINTGGVHATEFSRELQGAAQTAIAAIQEKKNKKKVSSTSTSSTNIVPAPVQQQQVQQQVPQQQQQSVAIATIGTAASAVSQIGTVAHSFNAAPAVAVTQTHAVVETENPEWTYDPNEPRYCICNQISYGEMVACDNADCPYEWFHYPCVNITASPKGKWYCPQCTTVMKRRGSRKN